MRPNDLYSIASHQIYPSNVVHVIDTESLDDIAKENYKNQLLIDIYNQPFVPNPLDDSEFDIKSDINWRANKKDEESTPQNMIKRGPSRLFS